MTGTGVALHALSSPIWPLAFFPQQYSSPPSQRLMVPEVTA
jgi:hypothetical protein